MHLEFLAPLMIGLTLIIFNKKISATISRPLPEDNKFNSDLDTDRAWTIWWKVNVVDTGLGYTFTRVLLIAMGIIFCLISFYLWNGRIG